MPDNPLYDIKSRKIFKIAKGLYYCLSYSSTETVEQKCFCGRRQGDVEGVKAQSIQGDDISDYASFPTSVFSAGFYLQGKIPLWKQFDPDLTQSPARYYTQSIR